MKHLMRTPALHPVLVWLVLSLLPSFVHAQIVADGATNTLSNVTTNITGHVTVGTNGIVPEIPQRYFRIRTPRN